MSKHEFARVHPLTGFLFFLGAIIFAMFYIHPLFLVISCTLSGCCLISIRGRKALRTIGGLLVLFAIISLANPLVNPQGETVLFTYMGSRSYTLEAVCYGMAIAGMFLTVIFWFNAYNDLMSSDKFLYLFSRFIPAVSLLLTMVFRLVPALTRKLAQITGARKCIGKYGQDTSARGRARDGMAVISSLTGWALEGGIITADSMKSRGYGSPSRSSFTIYRMILRDYVLMGIMLVLAAVVIFCSIRGAAGCSYIPAVQITGTENHYLIPGAAAYTWFLMIPTGINLVEAVRWQYLRSGI